MNDLVKSRKKIDAIDRKLLLLLAQRIEIVKRIGEYKLKNNITVIDNKREIEVTEVLKAEAEKLGLKPLHIVKIWREIFKLAYEYEKK